MKSGGSDMEFEDGELRKTPVSKEPSLESLSISDDEAMDNLEIKPPQARIHKTHRKSKHSSSKRHSESSSEHRKKHHHSRTHREERHRHHREKKEERSKAEPSRMRHESRRDDKLKEFIYREEKRRDEEARAAREEHRRIIKEERRLEKEERRLEKEDRRVDDRGFRERDERIRYEKEDYRRVDKEDRRMIDRNRVEREERRLEKDEQRRLEREIRERLDHRRMEGSESAKEREEREIRRQRLMEAERVKETYRKDMEERRARREQRERSRSRERKLEAEQMETQNELERAGLVVMSDASVSPVREVTGDDVTPVGRSNGSDKRLISPAPRIPTSDSSSSSSRSSDSEDDRSRSSTDDEDDRRDREDERRDDKKDRKEEREIVKSPSPPPVLSTLPPYLPAIQGCRSVEEYHCLNRIEEGTYGVVYRARDKRTEEIVALKRLKMEKEKEGFPITSLREISTILKAQHPNIVTVKEIVVGSNMDKIFIVMDYVEHDLKSLMETMKHKKQAFVPGEVKCLMIQLLKAVAHLHDNWILHRDLKTSNLLLSHKGVLRVGDFGLAREYGSPLKNYTPIVVTLWYRAPELLLGIKEYSTPIDMWSVGCIFAELLTMEPLFTGKSELDQLNKIFKALGTPNERIWPGYNKLPAVQKMTFTEFPVSTLRSKFPNLTDQGLSLLNGFLTYNPAERATGDGALKHPYFSEVPLAIDPAMFPTWPAKSEPGYHRKKMASPKPPSGGRDYKQLEGDTDEGFHMNQAERTRSQHFGPGFSLKF